MDWGKFVYLLIVVILGYAPYKILQRASPRGLTDITSATAILLASWFLILSTVLFIQSGSAVLSMTAGTVTTAVITTLVWFLSPFFIRRFGTFPQELTKEKPNWFVVRFDPPTFYLKFFEVIFQQIKFLFMLFVVLAGFSYMSQVAWFTLIIGFFHLQNMYFIPKKEAMIFFILSFPGALLFSVLILRGYFLIALSIHLWFYLIFAGYPWFQKKYAKVLSR
jgi:hypothetical protein